MLLAILKTLNPFNILKIVVIFAVGLISFFTGKTQQINRELNLEIENDNDAKKREFKRKIDSDAIIRKRLQAYTRESKTVQSTDNNIGVGET